MNVARCMKMGLAAPGKPRDNSSTSLSKAPSSMCSSLTEFVRRIIVSPARRDRRAARLGNAREQRRAE